MTTPLLEVSHLQKYYPVREGVLSRISGYVKAVDDISFSVGYGETFGIVGESGCGKSTTGRALLRLIEPTGGQVKFEGEDITALPIAEMRRRRRDMQLVFQDPFSSLDPRHTVRRILEEPLIVHGMGSAAERKRTIAKLIEVVGLSESQLDRHPHQFSGGQRQRIGIARAISLRPKLVVLDEPVSALDVSIQSQIINLLQDLQQEFGLAYLFIAHDLSVVRHITDRVAVMYLGRIVELAGKNSLYDQPLHPYTKALLSAVPEPDPEAKRERILLGGDVPSPVNAPSGCSFHTRCPHAFDRCRSERPELNEWVPNHWTACHLYDQKSENLGARQ